MNVCTRVNVYIHKYVYLLLKLVNFIEQFALEYMIKIYSPIKRAGG